jgi:glycosyltransferase involved in cell wall biosynthesis
LPPLVSVIVPGYNHAVYLQQRMETVLAQTYSNFEVILLDDCSTDDSRHIIESYRSQTKVSQVVYNDVNSGSAFKQWEKGIELAKGELIWIAESDDYCEPEFLASLVPLLENNPAAGLAYCLTEDVDENGKIITEKGWWTKDLDAVKWTKDHIQNGKEACRAFFVYKNIIPNASGVVFRKPFFKNERKTVTSMQMCGDWYFWISILLQSDYAYTAQCLNYQRRHTQTTRNINTLEKQLTKINEELKVYYLLLKHFGSSLAKNNRLHECFIDWIAVNEKNIAFSSVYKWPLFYRMNWAVYFGMLIKFRLYPAFRVFKVKGKDGV